MIGYTILCTIYVLCSMFLLIYGIQCYVLTFLYIKSRKEKVKYQNERMGYLSLLKDTDSYPTVVTQLPMYNEKYVALRIIDAAASMDYPVDKHEIQVLDDSNDETRGIVDRAVLNHRKCGINISVIRREDRTGFKAGALQNGLEKTKADFVAIFDSDFEPYNDFLKKSLAFFIDNPELGLVQGRWTHLNKEGSLLTKGQAMGIDGHFMVEQAARSWNNLFMNFNGTGGVFRREAIYSAGGWQHDTLTEDMDLSYRMQLKGWKTEYVPGLEVPAEIPEDINAFKNQQFRWAKGSIQTAIKVVPLLIKNRIKPFKFFQALLHLTHYVVHPLMFMMALLTMPVLYFVKLSLHPAIFACVIFSMVLATSGPSTMYMISQHYLGNKSIKKFFLIPIMMLIGTGLAVNNGKAVLEAVMGKSSPFHRTPKKGGQSKKLYRPIKDFTPVFELILGLYCVFSFYTFFGYSNFIVSPFLILYASGFLFVGMLSLFHFKIPALIDMKISAVFSRRV